MSSGKVASASKPKNSAQLSSMKIPTGQLEILQQKQNFSENKPIARTNKIKISILTSKKATNYHALVTGHGAVRFI